MRHGLRAREQIVARVVRVVKDSSAAKNILAAVSDAEESTAAAAASISCVVKKFLPHDVYAPQHFLDFLPEPQGQGSLRPIF